MALEPTERICPYRPGETHHLVPIHGVMRCQFCRRTEEQLRLVTVAMSLQQQLQEPNTGGTK